MSATEGGTKLKYDHIESSLLRGHFIATRVYYTCHRLALINIDPA